MKNKLLIIASLFLLTYQVSQAKNIINHFEDMPARYLLHLDANTRSIMIKMYNENPENCVVDNFFGGKSRILSLDTIHKQILVQLSDESRLEMKALQFEDKTILAVIRTVCSPICHSYIQFYTQAWNPINDLDIPKVYASDWITDKEVKIKDQRISNFIVASFIEMYFQHDTNELVFKNNSLEYLSDEDRKLVAEYFDTADKKIVLSYP